MRLIHSNTLELIEFNESNAIPPYAILSHTWGSDEISFQELSSIIHRRETFDSQKREAYTKIKGCYEQAERDGFDYVWIDTCCIDKTNSAELSEAINSMYQWYRQAEVCYVYLSDMGPGIDPNAFLRSKWFTRGWTLQELVAPSSIIFFNMVWNEIGTKLSLHEDISQITRIPSSLLLGLEGPEDFTIAQRMSWASNRKTKRVEDVAYCLMGIFDINMPMIYGEGHRAFIRLQEEILRTSTDQSIFAWESNLWDDQGGGLLASSPSAFVGSGNIIQSNLQSEIGFNLTSHGLSVKVPMAETCIDENIEFELEAKHTFTAVLDCERSNNSGCLLGISLQKITGTKNHFRRAYSHFLEEVKKAEVNLDQTNISNVFVQQLRHRSQPPAYQILVFELSKFYENGFWEKEYYYRQPEKEFGRFSDCIGTQAIRFSAADGIEFFVIFGTKNQYQHIKIFEAIGSKKSIEELISEFENESKVHTDRMLWQHPGGRWYIYVALKRRIFQGRRVLLAKISCEDGRRFQIKDRVT